MSTPNRLKIGIVGVGNVGVALGALLLGAGHQVTLGSRSPGTKTELLNKSGWGHEQAHVTSIEDSIKAADLVLLTVPDNCIVRVANAISDVCPPKAMLAHCSGLLSSQVLAVNGATARPTCSLHPLNTFPNLTAAVRFGANQNHASTLVCEGDAGALSSLFPVFTEVGFHCVEIKPESKPLYHAASVMVCNYLTVLMDSGLRVAELAGLDPSAFWRSVQPLVATTLENTTDPTSLSGPIARGDTETVASHMEQLSAHSEQLLETYRVLGRSAVALARRQGQIDPEQAERLLKALEYDAQDIHTDH